MPVVSLDPPDENESRNVEATWSSFMRTTSERSKDGGSPSKDGRPRGTSQTPKKEAAPKKAGAKRDASPKKRTTSKPRDQKLVDAALNTEDVRSALNDLAMAFQSGSSAASSQAVEAMIGGHHRPRLERFPTPPGFEEAFAKMQKAPKCPGHLSDGCNFFGRNGFSPPDRTAQKANFPDEVPRQMVAHDWKAIQSKSKVIQTQKGISKGSQAAQRAAETGASAKKSSVGKSSSISGFFKHLKGGNGKEKGMVDDAEEDVAGASSSTSFSNVPLDFNELAKMNAGIIGADMSWFLLVLKNFEQLLGGVVNADSAALEVTCDVLALQLSREAKGRVTLKDFQTCMLASARAMLPESWSSDHEGAWIKVWECISGKLQQTLELPSTYEKAVGRYMASMSDDQKKRIGTKTFTRLFKDYPKAENHFKANNARLASFVAKALDMAARIFHEPVKMVDEITELGLKHIMFQASTKFFQPFVSSVMAEIQLICKDDLVIQGLNWALSVIASIMVRTIETGATPILKAVVRNDTKELKRALSKTPRGERNQAILGAMK